MDKITCTSKKLKHYHFLKEFPVSSSGFYFEFLKFIGKDVHMNSNKKNCFVFTFHSHFALKYKNKFSEEMLQKKQVDLKFNDENFSLVMI